MRNKIIWEKYENPLSQPKEESFEETGPIGLVDQKVLFTSQGVVPLNENVLASSKYDLWMGFTNFKISTHISNRISGINGVEIMEPISPYRFMVGFMTKGGLFDRKEVKKNIERVCQCFSNQDLLEFLHEDSKKHINLIMDIRDEYWVAHVFRNGQIHLFKTKSKEQHKKNVAYIEKISKQVGGFTFIQENKLEFPKKRFEIT